jgi:hypothetical protein
MKSYTEDTEGEAQRAQRSLQICHLCLSSLSVSLRRIHERRDLVISLDRREFE